MGGRLSIRVVLSDEIALAVTDEVQALLDRVAARIGRWAARLTRHDPSELTRLNAAPGASVLIGPTLAAVLAAAAEAHAATDGLVDVSLLDARLNAETGAAAAPRGDWSLQLLAPGGVIRGGRVYRAPGVHLDLGGVAKGWIADRAAALLSAALDRLSETRGLPSFHSVLIDTDGDLSLVIRSGRQTIAIGIPERADPIGWLDLPAGEYGVATSGVGVHHWGDRHHLIDPRTGAPAASGVVQATIVAASARCAEAHAKAVVIGGAAALRRAEQDGIERMVLIDHADRILSTPAVELRPRVRFTVA